MKQSVNVGVFLLVVVVVGVGGGQQYFVHLEERGGGDVGEKDTRLNKKEEMWGGNLPKLSPVVAPLRVVFLTGSPIHWHST